MNDQKTDLQFFHEREAWGWQNHLWILQEKNENLDESDVQKILKEFATNEDGKIQLPFEQTMFLLRNYSKRSVISEDGKVYIGAHEESIDNKNKNHQREDEVKKDFIEKEIQEKKMMVIF